MRINDWPMEKMMVLPDWCFGRQYAVCVTTRGGVGATVWDISELAFPDVGVIWQVSIFATYWTFAVDYCRLALGDQLPATTADMDRLEPLIHGLGAQGAEPREINLYVGVGPWVLPLRQPVQFQGKRLIVEARATAGKYAWTHVIVVVSSMPKEVPDWLRW